MHISAQHEAAMQQQCDNFVGRTKLLKEVGNIMKEHRTGLVLVTGKPGSGKSALMVQ